MLDYDSGDDASISATDSKPDVRDRTGSDTQNRRGHK